MLSIRNAFENYGIKALFHGRLATVLPVDRDMEARLDYNGSSLSTPARAGQMMVTWTRDGKEKGRVIDADQSDGLDFVLERIQENHELVCAGPSMGSSIAGAALEICHMKEEDRQNPGDFVKGAFKGVERLLRCVQDCFAAKKQKFAGINDKMRKALIAGGTAVSMLAMAGCQTTTAAPRLLIDGPLRSDIHYDLNQCRELARAHTMGDGSITKKAVAGGLIGGLIKLGIDDSASDLGRTAGAGAIGGVVVAMYERRERQKKITAYCMRKRGHNVLDVDFGM